MDWMKLFILLVAVVSAFITTDAAKKKIRIHLPQRVKHIHHHKKIYITNHPAPSQYAPAYMPSAEGAVAVPTNIAIPAVANIVPISSVELIDESHSRLPGIAPPASKLLPLYRARGYYGPNHSDWNEQEFDLVPPPDVTDHSYLPTAFPAPGPGTTSGGYSSKRVKIIKVNDTPLKKPRKTKPKRVIYHGKSHPEGEHPVSTFHEQFYSDLEGSSTIRKIKKPHRVEKIVDGENEHIHTYSEEHIHKVVFDNGPKITGMVGLEPVGSMSTISATHPFIPLKNHHTLLAVQNDPFSSLAAVGSMGTPSQLEYTAYNPRDVTHDHIFHDHGEIPAEVDMTKESLSIPPKVSYDSQGVKINAGGPKRYKNLYSHKQLKTNPTPTNDFSYYENIYTPQSKFKNVGYKPTPSIPNFDSSSEANLDDFRPIPSFRFKDTPIKDNKKPRNSVPSYQNSAKYSHYNTQQSNAPSPFSLSSTIIHDYKKSKNYAGSASEPAVFSNFKDPFANFKDDSYSNNFEYDTYASPSNVNLSDKQRIIASNSKLKSISKQNIRFGNQDQQSAVDQLDNVSGSIFYSDDLSNAAGNPDSFDQSNLETAAQSTAFTLKESSPMHQYYTAMALKALQGEQPSMPEASNDNYQYVEAPGMSSTGSPLATRPDSESTHFKIHDIDVVSTEIPKYVSNTKQNNMRKEKKHNIANLRDKNVRLSPLKSIESSTVRGKLKYGDKI